MLVSSKAGHWKRQVHMSSRHSEARLEATRSFYRILKESMGGSMCHFCKSEKVAHVKHRSTALNFVWLQFGCQNKSLNTWVPWTLDVFQSTFPPQPLFSLHYSYWQTLDLKSEWRIGKVLPERTGIAPVVVWCQTAGFHLPLCISAWQLCLSLSLIASSHQPA